MKQCWCIKAITQDASLSSILNDALIDIYPGLAAVFVHVLTCRVFCATRCNKAFSSPTSSLPRSRSHIKFQCERSAVRLKSGSLLSRRSATKGSPNGLPRCVSWLIPILWSGGVVPRMRACWVRKGNNLVSVRYEEERDCWLISSNSPACRAQTQRKVRLDPVLPMHHILSGHWHDEHLGLLPTCVGIWIWWICSTHIHARESAMYLSYYWLTSWSCSSNRWTW